MNNNIKVAIKRKYSNESTNLISDTKRARYHFLVLFISISLLYPRLSLACVYVFAKRCWHVSVHCLMDPNLRIFRLNMFSLSLSRCFFFFSFSFSLSVPFLRVSKLFLLYLFSVYFAFFGFLFEVTENGDAACNKLVDGFEMYEDELARNKMKLFSFLFILLSVRSVTL